MSGEQRRGGAPQGPPWPPELLADFQAGLLDRKTTEELHPRVHADPEAREILSALETTGAELADLPPLPIPDDVATRIDSALREEARSRETAGGGPSPSAPVTPGEGADSGGAGVVDLDRARRRRRRAGWGVGLVSAAAAVLGVLTLTPVLSGTGGGDHGTRPTAPGPAPLALQGGEVSLDGQQFSEVLGSRQYSALSDPAQLIGCLQANGVDSGKPLGAREITLDGEPAQLFVLSTGRIGEFRLLAVGPGCGPGNPATLSDTTFGG